MRWITISQVLAIHDRQLAEHGGGSGVRDLGLLESALARPQNTYAYDADSDVARLAAAYAFGIVKNHPFIDGNKRTGYVVMETFIVKNAFTLTATQKDKYLTFLALGVCRLNWLTAGDRALSAGVFGRWRFVTQVR